MKKSFLDVASPKFINVVEGFINQSIATLVMSVYWISILLILVSFRSIGQNWGFNSKILNWDAQVCKYPF